MRDMIVARVDKARALLAEARDAVDAKKVVDMAHAAEIYAKRQKLSQESIDYAHAVKVDAMTLMGAFLMASTKNKGAASGGRRKGLRGAVIEPRNKEPKLAELGIEKKEASICQKLAVMAKEEPKKHEAIREARTPISSAFSSAHVSQNSGNSEWYTPEAFINAARSVLGGIDLDPASSKRANEIVGAKKYFTEKDDGLSREWFGKVWLNPPYVSNLVGKFTGKLLAEYRDKNVTDAMVLVNNATETKWFQALGKAATGICFPDTRVKFWSPEGFTTAPLQGQALFYFGESQVAFIDTFEKFGLLVHELSIAF